MSGGITSAGSPEVLTPTSYITFADMVKRKKNVDANLLCSVDTPKTLGRNILHLVVSVLTE